MMINEEWMRKRIDRINTTRGHMSASQRFALEYRDLVIAIADGEVEGSPRRLCQILGHAEIDAAIKEANEHHQGTVQG